MTRAQLQHVFSFILIAIVIVTTLFLGLRFIGTLNDKTCDAGISALQGELEEIAATYDTRGTKQDVTLRQPCDATHLCILSQDATRQEIDGLDANNAIKEQLKLSLAASTPRPNIFLVRDGTLEELATLEKLSAQEGAACIEQDGGRFSLYVEGRGRTVSVR